MLYIDLEKDYNKALQKVIWQTGKTMKDPHLNCP